MKKRLILFFTLILLAVSLLSACDGNGDLKTTIEEAVLREYIFIIDKVEKARIPVHKDEKYEDVEPFFPTIPSEILAEYPDAHWEKVDNTNILTAHKIFITLVLTARTEYSDDEIKREETYTEINGNEYLSEEIAYNLYGKMISKHKYEYIVIDDEVKLRLLRYENYIDNSWYQYEYSYGNSTYSVTYTSSDGTSITENSAIE